MGLTTFDRLFVWQGKAKIRHGQKCRRMRPILKNIALLQDLIDYAYVKIGHARVQHMVMRALDHRYGVNLHIADVLDRLTHAR